MTGNLEANVDLPKSWLVTKLGSICEVVRGGSPRPMGNPKYFSGNIPFLKIADVTKSDGKFVSQSVTHVNEEGAKKSRLLPKGSLILSNSGTVCIPKFLGADACIHDGFVSFLEIPEEIGKDYLYYYFHYLRPHVIQKHRQGITQVNLNTEIVSDFDLRIPPFSEQHRIVDKIEELFSDLDDGIASLKKAQQQLKVYRQAVLKWAFDGKLTAQWREEQKRKGKLESAETLRSQIKAERERRYQGKYQEPVIPELLVFPQIPEEWSLVTLDQLSLLITSGSRGWAKYYSNSGDFFIRAQDINTDSLRLDQVAYVNPPKGSEGQRTSVQFGDLLITITGANVTKSALVNIDLKKAAYVNQHVGLVRLSKLVSPKFVYYWIVSPQNGRAQLTKSAYGAGKPGLNLTNLKEVIVALPSLQEQNQIVEEIESRLSICDSFDATIFDNLQRAEALRQSILKQAFEGKLVPQDPNDEPASVLLERIRTSNAAQAEDNKQTKRKQSL
ncbi:MAG: restriction endonuclease subunit S [Nodosilinea sp.]